jgi:hypothetical protein
MVVFTLGGIFLGCKFTTWLMLRLLTQFVSGASTVNPYNKKTQIALIYLGCVFIGWNESICLTNTTVLIRNQQEIGIAGGTAGCIRSIISAVLETVYISIFTNRLTETIIDEVPPALISASLPASSVGGFLEALTLGTSFSSVAGITNAIIEAGSRAYKMANADAYRTVYLATIAFSCTGILLSWFAPNTDEYMSSKVAATLHHVGQEDDQASKESTVMAEV